MKGGKIDHEFKNRRNVTHNFEKGDILESLSPQRVSCIAYLYDGMDLREIVPPNSLNRHFIDTGVIHSYRQ